MSIPGDRSKAPLIAIIGTTASGKTSLAVDLAEVLDGEIISADSRQVYRRMDIGTGKDFEEYKLANGKSIPYHLIDIVEPGEVYNLYSWLEAFHKAKEDILARNKQVILSGGSGLYLETALSGKEIVKVPRNESLREELELLSHRDLKELLSRFALPLPLEQGSHRRAVRAVELAVFYKQNPDKLQEEIAHRNTTHRPLPHCLLLIDIPLETRLERINRRLMRRLDEGMVEEVKKLLDEGVPGQRLIDYGLEYRYITYFLLGEMTYHEAIQKLEIAIRQFAKRQMTWFRGMERRGFTIHRLNGLLSRDELLSQALTLIGSERISN